MPKRRILGIVATWWFIGAGGSLMAMQRNAHSTPRRLNNLVTELLAVPSPARGEHTFTNPRDGWVCFSLTAEPGHDEDVALALDGRVEPIVLIREDRPSTGEAMRYIPAGRHRVMLTTGAGTTPHNLLIRAVPELAFCKYQYDPHISEYGPYDWEFLRRHILPHVNTIVGSGLESHRPHIEEWKQRGGNWIVETGLPGMSGDPVSTDEAYRIWTSNPGLSDPLLDGIIVDEFFSNESPSYPAWTEAARRILSDPKYEGKRFYPYFGGTFPETPSSVAFFRTILASGSPVAWERYVQEQRDEATGDSLLAERLDDRMQGWKRNFPEIAGRLVVCFGYMTITESLDIHPDVDYKVWMDMQFRRVATEAAFEGLYGLMEYTSGYADEETVRWAARLYRHYGIEGNTELLSPRYGFTYSPGIIQNGDFEDGTSGWNVYAAEEGSIAPQHLKGYSNLQGRWPETPCGDTFLVMRRSSACANTIEQELRNLQAGKLYSITFITGDYGELMRGTSERRKHAVSVAVEGADVVPDRTFQSVVANNYAHTYGPFTAQNKYWFTYHRTIVRATGTSGRLRISDWTTPSEPGGPVGEELILNFMQVQPYFEG